jgi:hypothetical protein
MFHNNDPDKASHFCNTPASSSVITEPEEALSSSSPCIMVVEWRSYNNDGLLLAMLDAFRLLLLLLLVNTSFIMKVSFQSFAVF